MAIEVRHRSFNPTVLIPSAPTVLAGICAQEETNGWRLVGVVYVHQYEAVAVFERERREEAGDG